MQFWRPLPHKTPGIMYSIARYTSLLVLSQDNEDMHYANLHGTKAEPAIGLKARMGLYRYLSGKNLDTP